MKWILRGARRGGALLVVPGRERSQGRCLEEASLDFLSLDFKRELFDGLVESEADIGDADSGSQTDFVVRKVFIEFQAEDFLAFFGEGQEASLEL